MEARHALTVLNRLASRRPDRAGLLEQSLRGRLEALAEPALDVAVETGDPIGPLLAGLIQEKAGPELTLRPHRGKVSSFVLPGRSRIEEVAREASRALSDRGRAAASGHWLASLSEMILKPAASVLGSQRLIVVAAGALEAIPFAALPDPGGEPGKAPPLLAKHEIVNLPSASSLATLRRDLADRLPAPRRVAVLADPVSARDDPRLQGTVAASGGKTADTRGWGLTRSAEDVGIEQFPPLPYTADEARVIHDLVPEGMRFEAWGFKANRSIVLSGELKRYRILHFATHGILNPKHPELSGLVLSLFDEKGNPQDGFLRAHEICQLNLPAELVVLSACQTGLGGEVRGEGLIGLTRSFMYAGVPRVVVSLWNVSDRSTAELMKRFYQGLIKESLPPAAALRKAQLSMLAEAPWSSPYDWAPFVFQGEWRLGTGKQDGGIEQQASGSQTGRKSDDDMPPPTHRPPR